MGGRGSSLGKGNRPPVTSGSGQLGDGAPAPVEPAVPETDQVRPESEMADTPADQPATPEAPKPDPKPDKSTQEPEQPDPTQTGSPEERIRAAFRQVAERPGRFVKLADVRALIGDDIPPEVMSQTLIAMQRTGGTVLAPDSARWALTQADHDNAIRIGGEDKHLIAIQEDE